MPKKKALGRTSEPRHMPSTVAPISRRSPRLCCTYELKTQMSPVGTVVRTNRISGRFGWKLPHCPLEEEQSSARTGGAEVKVFFQRKIWNAEVSFMVIRIKLTAVVSKAKSGKDFAKKQCWFQTTGAIFTHVKKMSRKQQSIFQVFFFDIFLLCFWSAR